jgi:hypothetical protein
MVLPSSGGTYKVPDVLSKGVPGMVGSTTSYVGSLEGSEGYYEGMVKLTAAAIV